MKWSETELENYNRRMAGYSKEGAKSAHGDVIAPEGIQGGAQGIQKALEGDSARFGKKRGVPNKTESEYGRMLGMEHPGCRVIFEGMSFRMSNGHTYTPDWIVLTPDGVLCVETKARGANGYRLPSYQRAKLAFDQCKIEYSCFRWRWAERNKGIWEVS